MLKIGINIFNKVTIIQFILFIIKNFINIVNKAKENFYNETEFSQNIIPLNICVVFQVFDKDCFSCKLQVHYTEMSILFKTSKNILI